MPGCATVLTYGRRHQLRRVQPDGDDSWGKVVGDKSQLQRVFSSSFSSNNDSVAILSDSSLDGSAYLPSKSTKLRQLANSRTSQDQLQDKENKCAQTLGTKRAKRNGHAVLFSSSDSSTSNGSMLDSSKPKPLHSHDTNITWEDTKTNKVKKTSKTGHVKRTTRAKQQVMNKTSKTSIETDRKEANCQNEFAEFEEFSLCIEEEKPGRPNPVHLTPVTIGDSTPEKRTEPWPVERKTKGMSTSTPHTQESHQGLLHRLTCSNLKKIEAQQSTGSPITNNTFSTESVQDNFSRTVDSKASPIVALHEVSGRELVDSDLSVELNMSEGSFQVPYPTQKMVTMRRQRHTIPKDIVFDMSYLSNFSPMLSNDRPSLSSVSAVDVNRSNHCNQLCVPSTSHATTGQTPTASEIRVQVQPCQVMLERLKYPFEEVKTVTKDLEQLSLYPDCDASKSLFSDDGTSPYCLRNHSLKVAPNSSVKEVDSFITGPSHNLRNRPLPAYHEKEVPEAYEKEVPEAYHEKEVPEVRTVEKEPRLDEYDNDCDDDDNDGWVDTDNEDSEDEEKLSDIAEETGAEEDEDVSPDPISSSCGEEEDEEEEVDYKQTNEAADDDNENRLVIEGDDSASSDTEPSGDHDTMLYSLANDQFSQINKSVSLGESMYLTADSVSQVSSKLLLQSPKANTSLNTTPARKSLAKHLLKQLDLESSTNKVQEAVEDLEICHSFQCLTPVKSRMTGQEVNPRMKVLFHCDQDEEVSFNDCIPPVMMKKCVKIGEGVYGEVFRSVNRKESIALKIIPIEGNFPVNDEPQKTFAEILPEIVISKTLSDLGLAGDFKTPNFVQVKDCSLVQGTYPTVLIKQWDTFHDKKGSENDRPDMFPRDQLFIVFEFEDSGSDLEGFQFKSLHEAKSVFRQVTLSLAIAEESLQFEHRDLHWGNVLVRRTQKQSLQYTRQGKNLSLDSHGVQVAIIDFTLSRLTNDDCTVFSDLAMDPTMFEGEGDYQFDIYRKMQEENGNCWKPHHPYTNVLWLHYLADKLLYGKSYPSSSSKEHKALSRQFRTLLRELTNYCSATHVVMECTFFTD